MSELNLDTESDAVNAAVSSDEEDLEHDSSSDFVPSDEESDEESGEDTGSNPPNPGHQPRRHRVNLRDVVRRPACVRRSTAHSDSSSGSNPDFHSSGRPRYRPPHFSLCWENRHFIWRDYREIFEYEAFENIYPELSRRHIPRARCEAIMIAHMNNRDSRASSEKIRSICTRSYETEFECIPRNDFPPSAQPKCFLSLVPLEVQLQVLRYCLTSEKPFLDFCFGYRFAASAVASITLKGQDDVTLGILYTNRHFRAQGLRILWQENTFLYTRSDEFTLVNTDRLMTLPHVTYIRHLIIHQDCIWPPQMFYDRVMLNSILFAVSATEQLPALQSLHLDLVPTYTKPYCHERAKRVQDMLFEVQYLLRDIRAGRLIRHLQKVSVTGVSDDGIGCLGVKLASFLVDPGGGRLGGVLADVGDALYSIPSPGYRFTVIRDGVHEMVYMSVENVDGWLEWRRQQHGRPLKVFEWEDYFPVHRTREASLES